MRDADLAKFQALLTRFRGRMSREQVGLPQLQRPRPGTKAEGLTQSEVEAILGWARGSYHRLEGGRQKKPHEAQLDDLAKLFQLSELEYIWLYHYAGYPEGPRGPLYPESHATLPHLEAWRRMVDSFRGPAYVVTAEWELVATNQTFRDFLQGAPPDNLMRWLLFAREARGGVLVDWGSVWAPECVAQVRVAAAAYPENVALQELYQDVLDDPLLRRIHDRTTVERLTLDGVARQIRHPAHGRGALTVVSAQPSDSQGARLVLLDFEPSAPPSGDPAARRRNPGQIRLCPDYWTTPMIPALSA
ncbi:MmyB family transcriptional regulator (plasmid) [Streptomyces sp. SDT5-1]|uniref:MmyB family transcriptional regulator n=1 Tax=Streptomyces sp. SDT5-1 TaxID=3406418 RepID=UPI003FCF319A